jgi:hypothetical protein
MTDPVDGLLAEQARYYRELAGEYEDGWFRRGRYDRGADANARWFAEAAEVEDALERFRPAGRVLELACGTGVWTRRLVGHADTVTAVDASPEVIELRATTCVSSAFGSPMCQSSSGNLFGRRSGGVCGPAAGFSLWTTCRATYSPLWMIGCPMVGMRR